MSVYFSSINLNGDKLSVPAKAGWFEAENLRMIHALRYRPEYSSETQFTYQPQILAEKSNDVLANLARRKFEAETVFEADGKTITSGGWIEAKSGDLKSVGINKSKKVSVDNYEECDSFFYPANRFARLSVQNTCLTADDVSDSVRGFGYNNQSGVEIFDAASVYFEFDYARVSGSVEAAEILGKIESVFKNAGLRLKFVCDVFKAKKITVNGKDTADYRAQGTIELVFDLLMRLSGISKCNLQSSAILLIENKRSVLPEILTAVFPKIQFISN